MTSTQHDVDFWKKWSQKEIIYQMAVINFIGNKDKRETILNHIEICNRETQHARDTVPCQLDIPYGSNDKEKLDVYGTDLPANATTLFWVHGGFWRSGEKSSSGCFVKNAYERGFKTVVIDYPLAPEARLGAMCNSVRRALEKSMSILPISNFILGGYSAGGQLVTSLLHEIPGVRALPDLLMDRIIGVILISGAFDMRPVTLIPFINDALQAREEETIDFSPVLNVDKLHSAWTRIKNRLAFHISTAENEPPSLKKFAVMYADLLKNKGFSVEHWVSPDDDHFSELENLSKKNSAITIKLLSFMTSISENVKSISKL